MHVSKKPAAGGSADRFFRALKTAAAASEDKANQSVEMVHKKIKLNADYLAWEHELFNVKRVMAFTL